MDLGNDPGGAAWFITRLLMVLVEATDETDTVADDEDDDEDEEAEVRCCMRR